MSSSQLDVDQFALTQRENLTTLQSHILTGQARHPDATGTFSWILSAISLSAKVIAAKIRRARIDDVLGGIGSTNVQGEKQQKLDVIANETLMRCLGNREGVAIVASDIADRIHENWPVACGKRWASWRMCDCSVVRLS